jgi:glutaredoxin
MQNEPQENKASSRKPRRINGMIILLIIVVGLIFVNYRPSVARVHCTNEILQNKPEVIMLGTWWCPYCYQARRYLTSNNISYCEYDIEQSVEGEKLFADVKGQVIPVLLIGKYKMEGFDETRLEQIIHRTGEDS